ncbi:alpha-galactosidase (melibiase) [Streptococcus infantarius subsp. infantarius]|uniref:alpha-galactosidase n=1 Tax=Streptococcus sp. TaxID=1306 RepID=UPI000ED25ADA|nr:alpha-galactosidase [Streptococcus sp.]MCO4545155.1 alpha-galactosidase (melibiase) [Streptococcus infantarius subsp. infantarius]MCO4547541.1 alpha-galactosidase (melibiase) [Streptococcus infantarius subsp. infantarius]MCO4551152.1 alpha-galactosidase (melibiase) [Streptococcus infantarius subsp. infantarius]MCO4554649.1 alpha-galactosidase (melibiase) [Streptococcus infantarius subsp. infantarius]MCO4556290.1 alpha-galactosidase (melibiase) [Streptococcus infantarius subsp. infantarius]
MGIKIEGNLFYVNSKNMSLIIENREGDLLLRHIGGKITAYHGSNALFEKDHAFSGNPTPDDRTYSFDTQRQILGVHGFGDFRQPSISISHDTNDLTQFKLKDCHVLSGAVEAAGLPNPHSTENAETLALVLEDKLAGLELTLYYTAYAERSTISSFAKISNLSDKAVVINRVLSTMLDVPASDYDVVTLQGAYAREKTVRRHKLEQGIFTVASNRGASGHAHTPAMVLCDHTATEDAGQALALQLLYSGNFQAFVQKNQLNEVRLGIGINDDNFAWELSADDSFDTPVAIMTYSAKGLTHLTHESQLFVQEHIMPKQFAHVERPILINNWEATYFDFKKEKLLDLADEASKLGIELFVLDDGWFGNRFDDNRALGDWVVNEEKLGGPLNDLINQVHAKGLKFGLWFEPEMISVDSDLYREHPDWGIQSKGRGHTYSRNQLVLNLANPEVVAYIKSAIDKILTENAIDYVKWDYNRNITNIGNGDSVLATQMQSHAYMLGLYDLVSYLTEKHSNILFESCSGGGGRNDLGMMRYFPQVWASDNTDAISRLPIQYGSSYLYPTISMGAHVSASPNHQMGRTTPLETRGNVAMMGNLGYELDLTSLPQAEKDVIAAQVAHYKDIRPVVQFGKQYRLINPEAGSNEAAVEFVYEDKVVVTYVRTLSTIETIETTLKLKGLEEEALYCLQGTDQVFSGAELMYAGLTTILPQGDYLSKQYYFVKQ